MKAYDIKKGNVVEYNGGAYQIRDIERSSPQGRGGNVKYRIETNHHDPRSLHHSIW